MHVYLNTLSVLATAEYNKTHNYYAMPYVAIPPTLLYDIFILYTGSDWYCTVFM